MLLQRHFTAARFSGLVIAGILMSTAALAEAIKCSTNSTVKDPFYPGKASSDVYDNRFSKSHRIPFLPGFVPQGMAAWSNWPHGRPGDDLLLITSYDPGKKYSLIIGVDAQSGTLRGAAKIRYTHAGGIAVFEKFGEQTGWAFVSDEDPQRVRKYSLAKLADAILESEKEVGDEKELLNDKKFLDDMKILEADGEKQRVIASSFLTSHGPTSTLWAGKFNDSGRGRMKSYRVEKSGNLLTQAGTWEAPTKTQGVVVTKDFFIYSTSLGRNNRSNLYVVRRGTGEKDLDKARLFCFRSPSMSEGIAVYGDDLYVLYESGAGKYNPGITPADPTPDVPRNIISNLHKADLSSLKELPPRSGPTRPGPIGPDKRKVNR